MTKQYMSYTQVAEYLGVKTGALGSYKLPQPDVLVGNTRGWEKATIEEWNANRPGKGKWSTKKQ